MQLMIYLKAGVEETAERSGKLVIPAGVLYYNIDDPMVEGKGEKETVEHAILKGLKMDGLLNEDDPVLPSLDSGFLADGGKLAADKSSYILPFATNKDGWLKKTSKTVTTKDFADLMEFTEQKLKDIRNEIMDGKIAVNPYRKLDSSGETACQYCPYKSICRFDTKIQGNEYRILEKLGNDEVMSQIRGESGKE
jgi:ATP-dependent nuclease, subunit B